MWSSAKKKSPVDGQMKNELIKSNAGGQDIVHVGGHAYGCVNLKLHSWPIRFHFLHTRSRHRQMLVDCKVFFFNACAAQKIMNQHQTHSNVVVSSVLVQSLMQNCLFARRKQECHFMAPWMPNSSANPLIPAFLVAQCGFIVDYCYRYFKSVVIVVPVPAFLKACCGSRVVRVNGVLNEL